MAETDHTPSIADILDAAGVEGPHIVYVDSTGCRANLVILTFDDPVTGSRARPELSDRERHLIRSLLHLAQDRLDSLNPHD